MILTLLLLIALAASFLISTTMYDDNTVSNFIRIKVTGLLTSLLNFFVSLFVFRLVYLYNVIFSSSSFVFIIFFISFVVSMVSSCDVIFCINETSTALLDAKELLDQMQQDSLYWKQAWLDNNYNYVTSEDQLNPDQLEVYNKIKTEGSMADSNVREQIAKIRRLQSEIQVENQRSVTIKRNISELGETESSNKKAG